MISFEIPDPFPLSIFPVVVEKNPSDFRKVIIEGDNEACLALAENLIRL